MTVAEKEEAKWVPVLKAAKMIGVSNPKFRKLVEHYHFEIRQHKIDGRIRLVDVNAVKRAIGTK